MSESWEKVFKHIGEAKMFGSSILAFQWKLESLGKWKWTFWTTFLSTENFDLPKQYILNNAVFKIK